MSDTTVPNVPPVPAEPDKGIPPDQPPAGPVEPYPDDDTEQDDDKPFPPEPDRGRNLAGEDEHGRGKRK